MDTDRLAKMYDRLTPKERLPLLQAAEKRGDPVEQQRLLDSAPNVMLQVPDHWRRAQALNVLALAYATQQLEQIATYWHAIWRLTGAQDDNPDDWLMIAAVSAYLVSCNAEAWRMFCSEENIDAKQLIAGNYTGWMLDYCIPTMPTIAPSREELSAVLKQSSGTEPTLVTAETLRARWRHLFDLVVSQESAQTTVQEVCRLLRAGHLAGGRTWQR